MWFASSALESETKEKKEQTPRQQLRKFPEKARPARGSARSGPQACRRTESARFDETTTDEQKRDGRANADIARRDPSIARSGKYIDHACDAQPGREIARAQGKNRIGAHVAVSRIISHSQRAAAMLPCEGRLRGTLAEGLSSACHADSSRRSRTKTEASA
jgi:hypothetical protein